MYADKTTIAMEKAINETNRRRKIQQAYNDAHGITPQTIKKAVRDLISISKEVKKDDTLYAEKDIESMSKKELEKVIKDIDFSSILTFFYQGAEIEYEYNLNTLTAKSRVLEGMDVLENNPEYSYETNPSLFESVLERLLKLE